MTGKTGIIWDNQEAEFIFKTAGLHCFEDFWNIEDIGHIELQVRRRHIADDGMVERQTVLIQLDGKDYFLKRTSGRAFKSIKAEFRALSYIPEFGLVPPKTAAFCFDETTSRGFIVFKNMDGFYCLGDIFSGRLPREKLDSIGDVTRYYPRIIYIFKGFQLSDYFYRDWMDKHIFINPETDEIGLIDLERFLHKSEAPFHWRLPFFYGYKRKKERRKLLEALRLDEI